MVNETFLRAYHAVKAWGIVVLIMFFVWNCLEAFTLEVEPRGADHARQEENDRERKNEQSHDRVESARDSGDYSRVSSEDIMRSYDYDKDHNG